MRILNWMGLALCTLAIVFVSTEVEAQNYGVSRIVAHPTGCPRKRFCGCGTALKVFGKHRRDLWAARAWFRYPKAAPAPGMVAVRQHHVFYIMDVLGPNKVLAYDPNSGRNKTRIHVRTLNGFSVRNPHG